MYARVFVIFCHFLTYTVVYMRQARAIRRADRPGGVALVVRPRLARAIRRGPLARGSLRMPRGTWVSAQFPRSSSPLPAGANGKFLTNNDVKNDMGLTVIGFRLNG